MTAMEAARRVLSLLDLTSLNDGDTPAAIKKLCAQAVTPHGAVAAVCVWPRFVTLSKHTLGAAPVKVAAVANFPHGSDDIAAAVDDARRIADAGGDEVDVVFPYHAWRAGDHRTGHALVAACKAALPDKVLKVILETGELRDPALIATASRCAIDAGADFIKTSTGKTPLSATPEAARIMLDTIRKAGGACGFKASGGIRDVTTAALYLDLAAEIMGATWISPATFRFGASGLLNDVLAILDGGAGRASVQSGEY